MATISVAMIARNEEKNLPRTLAALQWVDEIVIVDSGSIDKTPDIARSFGARFSYNRDFRGHSEQKNIAISQCKCDWILLLDADEVVSQALAEEIKSQIDTSTRDAYWIPRLNLFLTRWMKHGGLYPDAKLRLFRRGVTRVDESVGPHGTPHISTPTGHLTNHLVHFGYPDFSLYLDHMNAYSSETVESLSNKYQAELPSFVLLRALLNPPFGFIANYLFRFGWLDGAEGLIFHINHAAYVHWKYIKVWEARKQMSLSKANVSKIEGVSFNDSQ